MVLRFSQVAIMIYSFCCLCYDRQGTLKGTLADLKPYDDSKLYG